MGVIINKSSTKYFRKKLRNDATVAEKIFWNHIRKRQILGIKFRRQCSIGPYIVDFFSFEKKIVIEIDGDSHFLTDEVIEYDRNRQKFIESQGLRVIRFTNYDICTDTESCIDTLIHFLEENNALLSFSPARGE